MRSLTELQLHALSIEIPSSSLALAEVRIARTRHVIVDGQSVGKNDVFEACVSWENELKVKVQVQGTLRLLLGSYFGSINSGSANDEYCSLSTFVFFYLFNCIQIDEHPRCIYQRGGVTFRPTHDPRRPCGLLTHPGRKTNTRLSSILWFWPC